MKHTIKNNKQLYKILCKNSSKTIRTIRKQLKTIRKPLQTIIRTLTQQLQKN